ncbi:MAG: hypothetical protein E6Q97_04350 [Desulfurellales bacterium]|nr:MAG: hypothetical protein E6Q97_04350 [Desulfurellales bacterium]
MQVQVFLLSVMLWQWGVACEPTQFASNQPAQIEIIAPPESVVEQWHGGRWSPIARRFDMATPGGGRFYLHLRCDGEERRVEFGPGEAVRVEFKPRNFGVDANKIGHERYTLSGEEISLDEVKRRVGQLPDYRHKTRCVVVCADESRRRAFIDAAKSVAPDFLYQDYSPSHWVATSGGYKAGASGFAAYLVDDKGKGYWRQDSDNLDDFRQGVSSVRKPPSPDPNLPGPKPPGPSLPNIDLSNLPPWVPVALLIVLFVLLQRRQSNA